MTQKACDVCQRVQRSVVCQTPMNFTTAVSMDSTVERSRIDRSPIPCDEKTSKFPVTPTPAGTDRKDRFVKVTVVVGLSRLQLWALRLVSARAGYGPELSCTFGGQSSAHSLLPKAGNPRAVRVYGTLVFFPNNAISSYFDAKNFSKPMEKFTLKRHLTDVPVPQLPRIISLTVAAVSIYVIEMHSA